MGLRGKLLIQEYCDRLYNSLGSRIERCPVPISRRSNPSNSGAYHFHQYVLNNKVKRLSTADATSPYPYGLPGSAQDTATSLTTELIRVAHLCAERHPFSTFMECSETCRSREVCFMYRPRASCGSALVPVYYFNTLKDQCFEDRSCSYKGNNFPTLEECQRTCRPKKKDSSQAVPGVPGNTLPSLPQQTPQRPVRPAPPSARRRMAILQSASSDPGSNCYRTDAITWKQAIEPQYISARFTTAVWFTG
ncbi:hypothetical protein MTO96_021350 [Rhipicephalus appendiculatus]